MKNLQKLTIALVVLFSVSLFAQRSNLQDLVGAKGSSAEYALQDRGYVHINTKKEGYHVYANWWNSREQKCVTTHLYDGRVKSIKKVPSFDCNKGSGHSNLQDLVGAKGSSAEYALQDRGYVHINTKKEGYHIYANWWNPKENQCVSTHLYDGRIKNISKVLPYDCNKSSNGNSLHNDYSYSNSGYNEDYSHKRYNSDNFNDSYQTRDSRAYGSHANVHDLMKVSAPLAYDKLKERGFHLVKGGDKYKVWYNEETNQCIKTVSIQKHIHDILKSTHCN